MRLVLFALLAAPARAAGGPHDALHARAENAVAQELELVEDEDPVPVDPCAGAPPDTCRVVCADLPFVGPFGWGCRVAGSWGQGFASAPGKSGDLGVDKCCAFGGGTRVAVRSGPPVSPPLTDTSWARDYVPDACAPFAVGDDAFPSISKLVRSGKDMSLGNQGGHWSACTHLAVYGMNFAVFLVRALAFDLRPRAVLEFGCGLGTTSDFLARFTPGGSRVVCVEPEAMLAEVFARRPPPARPLQLAVDVFSAEGAACASALFAPRFDLVISFEVAEHLDPARQEAMIDGLAAATSKYLVFSAARPGQGGTGHIEGSMHSVEWWTGAFEKRGLVPLPGLTVRLRHAAKPERAYDLSSNLIAMGRPPLGVDRTDVAGALAGTDCGVLPSKLCKRPLTPLHGSHGALDDKEAVEQLRQTWVRGQTQALWPEVDLLVRDLRRGKVRCK